MSLFNNKVELHCDGYRAFRVPFEGGHSQHVHGPSIGADGDARRVRGGCSLMAVASKEPSCCSLSAKEGLQTIPQDHQPAKILAVGGIQNFGSFGNATLKILGLCSPQTRKEVVTGSGTRTSWGSGFVCARQEWVVCARQTVGRLCTFLLCVFVIVSL